jgi:ubiquinone biosynthesis protein COQ4
MSPSTPNVANRIWTVVAALATLARNPGRLDQVLAFSQAVNARALSRAVEGVMATETGRALLAEQPRIDRAHVDFDALRALPEGTLGREYVRFLDDNAIGPEPFEALPNVGDERIAWMMLRLRQTHDLWHVLTGYTPDVRGEVLLQAFTYAQVELPSSLVLAVFGSLRWIELSAEHLRESRRAWRRGRATKPLAVVRWEEHWATPVTDLRVALACPS